MLQLFDFQVAELPWITNTLTRFRLSMLYMYAVANHTEHDRAASFQGKPLTSKQSL